ncbi:hemicentin-1-like [Mytilus edulis]
MIRLKTSNRCVLHILVLLSLTTISFAQSPGNPVITGPTFIVEGNSVALTCTSSGGNPVPTVYWYRNGQLVDDTQTTTNGVTSNTYNFVADKTHNLAVFECQVDNNVLQNKLSTTWFFQVYTEPNQPTLTGSQSLSPGSTYVWTCISTGGNPAPTLTMRIGSSQFNTGITQSSVLQSDNTYTVTSSLSWAPSVSNNGQTLFCDVQHSETRGNNLQTVSLQLTVTAPLSVSAPQTQYQQNVGTLVVMNCVITGTATSITWYFNNQLINIASSSKYSNGNTINPSLTVSNVALSDAGQYYCQATNGLTTANSNTITLTVLGSIPVVTVSQPTYSGTTGQSVTLQCTVSSPNDALQSVSWTFNNGASTIIIAAFSNTAKYSGTTTTTPSLTIFNLASTDAGTYTCSATNTIGTGSSSATSLSVTGNLLSVTIPQSSYSVLTGQQVTIPCTVTGTPIQTNVFWRKVANGVQTNVDINGNGRYSGGTTSSPSLTITNTQSSDEGTYVCYASNNIGTSNSQNTFLDITGGVPTVTIGGSNFQVQVGNSITIGCTVTANPAVTSVYWTRDINGQSTIIGPSSNPSKYGGSTTVTPSLTILNADISDAGNYQCFAINNIGTGSSQQALLDVQGSVPTVRVSFPSYQVNIAGSLTLGCSVVSNPSHFQVYWRKNAGGITTDIDVTNSGGKYSGSTVSTPSLTINTAASSDEASYTCYATNSVGTGQSTSTSLTVVGNTPTVTIQQQNYNVNFGNSAVLVCSVTANPTHTNVFWRKIKNGVTTDINVANSNNKYSGSTVNNPSLQINNADLNDEANYACFASNSVGTGQSTQTFLDVTGDIPVVTISSNSYSVSLSGTVTLQCTVSANPTQTSVTWQRIVNGVLTTVTVDGSRMIGSTVSTPSLTISNAVSGDEGNYICTASNSVGTGTSQQTFLDVQGNLPTVTVGQNQYSGSFGQTVTMVCTVQANPSETSVYWRKLVNGQMTSIDMNNVRYTGSTVGSPSLTITALELSDEGYYQCYAQNSVGTGSSQQTFLDVIGNVPSVQVLSNTYSVNLGGTVVLGCQVIANPSATNVYWQKLVNGVLTTVDMSTNNFNKYSGSTVQSPSLTIISTTEADQGNYVCSATNSAGTASSSQTFLDVVGNLPTVSIPQSAYSVNVGSQITIPCTVSANPTETNIYWTVAVGNNAEQTISMTNTQKYQGSSVNSPSLIILSTTQSDSGVYRCHATNNVGTGQSNPTTLNVVGNIPVVTVAQTNYPVNFGQSVQLVCTVSATPTQTQVYWTRVQNGQAVTISTANTAKYSGSTVSNPSLTISNVDQNDETFYVCYATNSVGTGQSQQTYVDVSGNLPVVTVQSNSYSVLLGQTATLVCTISANPSATSVRWYKVINGVQSSLSTNAGKYNTPTVNSPNLIVNTAAQSDEGYYVCTATNIVGTGTSSQTYLTVTGNLPSVTVALSNYNTNIGATVTLGCTVVASPAATTVYWQRIVNNQQQSIDTTSSNSRYSGSTVSNPSMVITNAQSSDEGNYICYATNNIGTGNSQQTFLDVIGNIPVVTVQENVYSVNIGSSINLVCNVQANPSHTSVTWRKIINGVTTAVTVSGRFSGASVNSPTLTISNAILNDEGYYICFATNSVGTGQSSQTFLDVIGSVPAVTIGSNYYSVNYGNTATIVCNVVATPTETSISWQKIQNGIPSTVVISGRYQGGTVSSPNLIITSTGITDEAFYICSASNSVGTGQSSQTYLDVQGTVPAVQILSNYYSVQIGLSVTLQCTVTANPSHTSVTWKKIVNGQETNIGSNNRYSGGSTNTPSLTISNAVDTDEGYYICTAANAVGTGQSSQTYLDVSGSILTVTVPQSSYSVNYGQSVQLVCTVSGTPAVQNVYWQKITNGAQTNINTNTNSNKYSGSSTGTPSLTILNADSNDVGSYTCYATNSVGTGQSQQTQLSVVGNAPSVTVGQGYTIALGNSITLTCTVFATPSATSVQWNRITNNVPVAINVASNPNKYSGATVSTPSLTISNSVEGDEGYYTCQATNSVGTGTSTQTFLNVQGTIPVVTIAQAQYSVTVGSSVTMVCTVSANPAHTSVNWQKVVNGVSTNINLFQSNKYSGSTTSSPSLTVLNVVLSDEGYYTCSAQNSVGTGTSSQTFLDVSGSVPVVTVLSTSYSINVGNSITLQCTVSATPSATSVTWQRFTNNVATNIDMSSGRYSGSSVGSPSLVISNTVISDEGFYICKATNSVGSGQSQQTFLDVIGSIPTVTVPQSTYTVNRGSSVTLQCTYTSNPAPTSVFWERTVANQVTIISTAISKYDGSTTQSPSLIINTADESDEANYVCKVTNSVGTGISSSTFLDVLGNIPVVTAPTSAYTVNVGDSVTMTCTVTANPQHTTVYWQYISGGSSTNVNMGGRFSGSSVSSPSLTLSNAQLSDQGTYVCYATNSVGTGQSTQVVLAVTGSVPSVSLTQTSFTGNYGDTITLGCTVSANPGVTSVYWQKVSGSVTSTVDMSNSRYTGSSVSTPSLTITNLNSNDGGNYICLAANSVGTGQSVQGPLTVVGNVPVVTVSQPTYSTNIGNTIVLACVVSANPAHTAVYWTRQINNGNTETLNPASSTKYSGSTIQSPSLTINNVDTSDEGNYICHATNAVGTGQSSQTFLDIVGNIPSVTASIVSSVKVGNSVTITCTVTATPAATQIVWQRLVNSVTTTMDLSSNRYSGGTIFNPSLTINTVQEGDQGQYVCQATNSVGTGTSNNVYLTVTGDAPTSIAISPSPITVNEGQTITATCTALGSPTITYTWFKGNSNTQLSTGSVLQITSSTRTDAGTYQCRASNTYGNADATVAVEVQYVPDVTISQPSQGSGGQAITIQCSYVSNPGATNVIWSKGNQGITVDGSKYVGGTLSNPSLTITNLAASDQGSYRCSVVNTVGQGDSSSVTLSVDTSTAPSYIRITPAGVVVQEGQGFTLTCDADGDPAPIYNWYHHDVMIHEGAVLTISNSLWTEHDGLHLCKATNTKGSRQTWEDVDVQHIPVSTVAQTSILKPVGNPVSLSCDTRANPSATAWEWLYNGNSLSSTNKVLVVNMDTESDAGTYTCRATNAVGSSADIAFSIGIGTGIDPSLGASTGASSSLSTGEIAAIILAILFVLLLVIGIIICCCCQGYCASLCGGKKEKVTPQPAPKIVQVPVYYEEPEESVISLRKLEIPRFYEEPVIVASEPPTTMVRKIRHKKHRTYRRPSDEYEISKYQVLKPDETRELETTERARENTYVTSTGTRQQYYLPDVEYTYDEEEERRRRRRRRKKKSKRHHVEHEVHDNEIIVEDRIENGDVLRSSVRSRRSDHDNLRASTRSRDADYDVVTGEEFYYEQE